MPILSESELRAWKPPLRDWLIDQILLPETRLMIFGAAKAWKSMLALYTSYALARGIPWFGYKTKECAVLKTQLELPQAVDRERMVKFTAHAKCTSEIVLFKTQIERMKLDTGYGMTALEADIIEAKKRLPNHYLVLILDPLYKLMAGDLSDGHDVTKLQDNLDELKSKHRIAIIIIHHSRLTRVDSQGNIVDLGPEEALGSSFINNWCDTMIRVRVLDPPPKGAGLNVRVTFDLHRLAHTLLPTFEVRWDRATLVPRVTKTYGVDLGGEEPSIRGLQEE